MSNLFTFIDKDIQEGIFKRAEKNSRFMRGLGIGLGKVFPFINIESQSELFAKAQNNVEVAIGLGEGFGHIFVYLKKELRDKILEDLDKRITIKMIMRRIPKALEKMVMDLVGVWELVWEKNLHI